MENKVKHTSVCLSLAPTLLPPPPPPPRTSPCHSSSPYRINLGISAQMRRTVSRLRNKREQERERDKEEEMIGQLT